MCIGAIVSMAILGTEVLDELTHVNEARLASCAVDVSRLSLGRRCVVTKPMRDHCVISLECFACFVLARLVIPT